MKTVLFLGWVSLLAMVMAGCANEESLSTAESRRIYNDGLRLLRADDWAAAEEAFLSARNEAGQDGELRYRSAFNLGLSYANHAETLTTEDLEQAIELLRQSAAWFNDAVRLRDDEDARVNLELVLRRIQVLADQLNQGANSLEARLDRLVEDERSLRDGIRGLMSQVDATPEAGGVLAFEQAFEELAVGQRSLLAEAGTVSDLAGDEIGLIEQTAEEERTDAQNLRLAQLTALDQFMRMAREAMLAGRARLRRLEGETSHRSAEAALDALKRAREQLADPVQVLQAIAQDQMMVWMQTRGLVELSTGTIRLDTDEIATPPPWLTIAYLLEEEQRLTPRTQQVMAFFQAVVDSPESEQTDLTNPDEVSQQRMLDAAREAAPFVEQALAAIEQAALDLEIEELESAIESQRAALQALSEAIERFSGIRDVIELLFAEQQQVVTLLTPPGQDGAVSEENEPELTTEERTARTAESVERNLRRLRRLDLLLDDELQALQVQLETGNNNGEQIDPQEIEGEQQRFQAALELSAAANQELIQLQQWLGSLDVVEPPTTQPHVEGPLAPAERALENIEELRRLFFSIIEHLVDLLEQQGETHDQTAGTFGVEGEELVMQFGPIIQRQDGHAEFADMLAQALEQQADAAAASQDEQSQQAAERLAQAAPEVRSAAESARSATDLLNETVEYALIETVDVQPILDEQVTTMEHLGNAIRMLQPPQEQPPPEQQEGEQQQQEQLSQRQADQRLQETREREAQRLRERNNNQSQPDPVERDW